MAGTKLREHVLSLQLLATNIASNNSLHTHIHTDQSEHTFPLHAEKVSKYVETILSKTKEPAYVICTGVFSRQAL